MLLEPADVTLRMQLAKSRVTDRRGESVSPGSISGSSTISVILTPSLWLSQGGGVLISVEVSRANFNLHSSAIATAVRLATRAPPLSLSVDTIAVPHPFASMQEPNFRVRRLLLLTSGRKIARRRRDVRCGGGRSGTTTIARHTSHVTRHTSSRHRYAVAAACGSRARHVLTLKWNHISRYYACSYQGGWWQGMN
jgi:hypothetical protein